MGNEHYPIAGVVADFHQFSFHEPIKPLVIVNGSTTGIAIRLEMKDKQVSDAKAILTRVEKQWKEVYPHDPFEYKFMDESIRLLYQKEETTAWLMNIATGITIFISCMGLFGLALFNARQRSREIGIRKVLGASVTSIVSLLSTDFLKLVLLATAIASPVAWYFIHRWLQDFAYRIDIGAWVFVLAGLAAMVIALITVSFQAIKAAIANPIGVLGSE
jgi:ABC-type antimicrobial peptide transport system permease subunit